MSVCLTVHVTVRRRPVDLESNYELRNLLERSGLFRALLQFRYRFYPIVAGSVARQARSHPLHVLLHYLTYLRCLLRQIGGCALQRD